MLRYQAQEVEDLAETATTERVTMKVMDEYDLVRRTAETFRMAKPCMC